MKRQTVRLRLMTEPGGWCNSMERLGPSIRQAARATKALLIQLDREDAA
jgi:hypothetical protein